MFNRIESDKINGNAIIGSISMKKIGAMLVSVTLLASPILAKAENIQSDSSILENNGHCFEQRYYDYSKLIAKYRTLNEYDKNFQKFWKRGMVKMGESYYPLESFYLLYQTNNNEKEIRLVSMKYGKMDCLTGDEVDVSDYHLISFRNTTAFANFYNNNGFEIIDNKAVIKDMELLEKCVNEWDGMIHNLTPETDAIKNKQIVDWSMLYARKR